MGRHALRGAMSAWLGLIALQTIASSGGSGRIVEFFADVDRLVKKALDPNVPAIRDRRGPAGTSDANGNWHPTVPDFLGGGTQDAPGSDTSGQQINPNIVPYDGQDPAAVGQSPQSNPAYGGGAVGGTPSAYLYPGLTSAPRVTSV